MVSESVPTMDTRGKTNAKFRNEVNEILARHKTNFDQVHSALQAVLTGFQTLQASRSQNTSPLNPTHLHVMNPHTHILLVLTL